MSLVLSKTDMDELNSDVKQLGKELNLTRKNIKLIEAKILEEFSLTEAWVKLKREDPLISELNKLKPNDQIVLGDTSYRRGEHNDFYKFVKKEKGIISGWFNRVIINVRAAIATSKELEDAIFQTASKQIKKKRQ